MSYICYKSNKNQWNDMFRYQSIPVYCFGFTVIFYIYKYIYIHTYIYIYVCMCVYIYIIINIKVYHKTLPQFSTNYS